MRFAIGSGIQVEVRPVQDKAFVGRAPHWFTESNASEQSRERIGIVHPPVNLAFPPESTDLKCFIVTPAKQESNDSVLDDRPRMAVNEPEFGPPTRTLAVRSLRVRANIRKCGVGFRSHTAVNKLPVRNRFLPVKLIARASRMLPHSLVVHLQQHPIVVFSPSPLPPRSPSLRLQIQSDNGFKVRDNNPNHSFGLEHPIALAQEDQSRLLWKMLQEMRMVNHFKGGIRIRNPLPQVMRAHTRAR